jgi:RNA recognition motif-containing protein
MLILSRFRDPKHARKVLEEVNGFDLAGRPIGIRLSWQR